MKDFDISEKLRENLNVQFRNQLAGIDTKIYTIFDDLATYCGDY